jgi:hypothetical protein
MSRFFVVCLLLSISHNSFSQNSFSSEFEKGAAFYKRVFSNIGTAVVEKPKLNIFTLDKEFRQCRQGPQENFAYNRECLEGVLAKTKEASKNNVELMRTLFFIWAEITILQVALNGVQSLQPGTRFDTATGLPFGLLGAEIWMLRSLRKDIEKEINKL